MVHLMPCMCDNNFKWLIMHASFHLFKLTQFVVFFCFFFCIFFLLVYLLSLFFVLFLFSGISLFLSNNFLLLFGSFLGGDDG